MNALSTLKQGHNLLTALVGMALSSVMVGAMAQTTTLGTRGSLSQANPPITSNASATWQTYTRAASYPQSITLPLQFITLSSGQKIAALVSVPADASGKAIAGAFPVILTQTAYRIDTGELLGTVVTTGNTLLVGGKDDYIIRRGYITVAVDALGTGMSGGQAALLGADEQEAYGEVVNWVTKQSWFNGNLGLAGTSYLGISSLLTAEQQNPAVKAVFAQVPMGDSYRGTVGTGGMLNAQFISLWLPLTADLSVGALNSLEELLNPSYASLIKANNAEHLASFTGWYLPTVNSALAGQTGFATDDGSFWAVRSPLEKAANIQVPTMIFGGTNDIFQRDEPLLYEQLKNNVNTKLVVVPGAHLESILTALIGANNASANGAPGSASLLLQWFDQYLKGMNTGAAELPNVTQAVQGYGSNGSTRYATATDWPHPQMTPQRMYLHGDLSLSAQPPLSAEPTHTVNEPKAPSVTYSVASNGSSVNASVTENDGSNCSISDVQWTLGISGLLPLPCYSNDSTVESSQHAINFTTPVLTHDLYINGPMQADVWVSASNTAAAISVRVDDVDAYGNATPISNGLLSASYRAVDSSRSRYVQGVMIQPWHAFTASSALAVTPGQAMLLPIEIFPNAALIRSGHRLQVSISASNQAQGIWSTPEQALANGNVSTILNDPAHPSSIVLPVVPESALN